MFEQGEPIGITNAHIELGTVDEGRLFYFEILPKQRGKSKGRILHKHSLH